MEPGGWRNHGLTNTNGLQKTRPKPKTSGLGILDVCRRIISSAGSLEPVAWSLEAGAWRLEFGAWSLKPRVLSGFIRFYQVLSGFIRFYQVVSGFIRFYQVFLWFYQVL